MTTDQEKMVQEDRAEVRALLRPNDAMLVLKWCEWDGREDRTLPVAIILSQAGMKADDQILYGIRHVFELHFSDANSPGLEKAATAYATAWVQGAGVHAKNVVSAVRNAYRSV